MPFRYLLMLLFAGWLFSCKQKAVHSDPLEQLLTVADTRKDFTAFRSLLSEAHPSVFLYKTEAGFNRYADSIYQTLQAPLSLREYLKKLYSIVAATGCAHTDINLPEAVLDSLNQRQYFFPYPVVWINNRLLLNHHGDSIAPGTELLQVNGIPVKQLLKAQLLYNTLEGVTRNTQWQMAAENFGFQYYLNKGAQSQFQLQLEDSNQNRYLRTVNAVSREEWRNNVSSEAYYTDDNSAAYDLRFNNDYGYAYLKIASFDFDTDAQQNAFEHFLSNSFQLLQCRPNIGHLIIDLRENHGGDLYNTFLLFSYLAHEPYREYSQVTTRIATIPYPEWLDPTESSADIDRINSELRKKFGARTKGGQRIYLDSLNYTWQPDPLRFDGKIYLIQSAQVASAGSYFAHLVKNSGAGILVGEETIGGSFSGNGFSTLSYRLPQTGIGLYFPYAHILYSYKGNINNGRGVIPNYYVPNTIASFKNNSDQQTNFIIDSLISSRETTSKK